MLEIYQNALHLPKHIKKGIKTKTELKQVQKSHTKNQNEMKIHQLHIKIHHISPKKTQNTSKYTHKIQSKHHDISPNTEAEVRATGAIWTRHGDGFKITIHCLFKGCLRRTIASWRSCLSCFPLPGVCVCLLPEEEGRLLQFG